jgi:hypothetical protein
MRTVVHQTANWMQNNELVAATSLSDIVCRFQVAGCETETTSDPAIVAERDINHLVAQSIVYRELHEIGPRKRSSVIRATP